MLHYFLVVHIDYIFGKRNFSTASNATARIMKSTARGLVCYQKNIILRVQVLLSMSLQTCTEDETIKKVRENTKKSEQILTDQSEIKCLKSLGVLLPAFELL